MKTATPTVEIINVTPYALDVLIFTKSGRLAAGTTLSEILGWPHEQKLDHLDYMMNTIKSSFEFVDYIFDIRNVSRAFTHQLVRTRTASYQQEAMRVVDAREYTCLKSCEDPIYDLSVDNTLESYGEMVDMGYPVQDVRAILPIGIHTRIMMKANLRTLSQMAELRLCKRAEGEYQEVFKIMVDAVLLIHPWAAPLLEVICVKTGICAFPRYTECPIQKYTLNKLADEQRPIIRGQWEDTVHVANPVSKDGKTM